MKIDKELIGNRFARSFPNYENHAIVQREIANALAKEIIERLPRENVQRALEIGVGTGFLSRKLVPAYSNAKWFLNDLSEKASFLEVANAQKIVGDAEAIPFPCELQLIASASVLQWFQDVPAFFAKSRAALASGGLLAVSTFGPDNFFEIREIIGSGLDYISLSDLEKYCVAAGFRLLCARERREKIFMRTPLDILHHIKNTGVNGIHGNAWTRSAIADFSHRYAERFSDARGNVQLTYHPILLILSALPQA